MRGVARAIDMTPSGLYRYFDDHGALLAALCVDAHDSLSAALEAARAAAPDDDCTSRWFHGSLALRTWALEHVDEFGLVVGPRVSGVDAGHPELARAAGRLLSLPADTVARAMAGGELVPAPVSLTVSRMAAEPPGDAAGVPVEARALAIGAVAALVGAVSLEAFGHLPGLGQDREEFYRAYALEVMRGMGFTGAPRLEPVALPAP